MEQLWPPAEHARFEEGLRLHKRKCVFLPLASPEGESDPVFL